MPRLIAATEILIIPDITNTVCNRIIVLLYIVLKKVITNTLSHRIKLTFHGSLGNQALQAQPTDLSDSNLVQITN